ncbi:MAG TPA: transposase [Dehalococcoidia bacterium]|nr:transposase [Dehalococcoidia bacterium]
MTAWLRCQGHAVNRKRVQRLMRRMGIEAIYRRPRTPPDRIQDTRVLRTCSETFRSTR